MSSFRDIALNIISSDTLLGRSMLTINHEAHDRIAQQMAEWERKNTVTVIPIGVSAEYTDPTYAAKGSIGGKIAAQSKRVNERIQKAAQRYSIDSKLKRNTTGHQNLIARANGLFSVSIGGENLGKYTKDEAIKVRDKYRRENDLPAAEY